MTKAEIFNFVHDQIANYRYDAHPDLLGRSWTADKIAGELDRLRACLTGPSLTMFELRDTIEQSQSSTPQTEELWLVAIDEVKHTMVFFDPKRREFGLATYTLESMPVTIGVRGDLVSTFMAR